MKIKALKARIYINDIEEPKQLKGVNGLHLNNLADFKSTYFTDVNEDSYRILVKMWYFGITTLSTIGYGDFHPVSMAERIIILPVLLFGVAIFSIIMSEYIEIILNHKSK
jgi:hypothetical protein